VGDEFIVKIDNDRNYVRNWRVDQILASDLFDEISVRNPEVERLMAERSGLLKRDDLTKKEKKRLAELNEMSYNLPTADNAADNEAMEIIRKAAAFIKNKQNGNDTDQ